MGEVIAARPVMLLEIGSMAARRPNSRLICGVRALLAARVDLELVIGGGVVAAIAGIGDTGVGAISP
jgi:hypothetical protein